MWEVASAVYKSHESHGTSIGDVLAGEAVTVVRRDSSKGAGRVCSLAIMGDPVMCKKLFFDCPSPHRHKTIHNPLPPRLFEVDLQLVALDLRDCAVAEFFVEHAHPH